MVALLGAWLMASTNGNAMLTRWRTDHSRHGESRKDGQSWAERRLERASWRLALLIGAVINLPGPFYLLALGEISRGSYSTVQQLVARPAFNAIMFLLLEVPLVAYIVRPEATAKRVTSMSRWLNANGLRITGSLVGLLGASLLVQGIAALADCATGAGALLGCRATVPPSVHPGGPSGLFTQTGPPISPRRRCP